MTRIDRPSVANESLRAEIAKQGRAQKAEPIVTVKKVVMDGMDGQALPTAPNVATSLSSDGAWTVASGPSPFVAIMSQGAPVVPHRLTAEAVALEVDLAPAGVVLAALGHIESGLLALEKPRPGARVREGLMLLMNDAIDNHAAKAGGVAREVIGQAGQTIWEAKSEQRAQQGLQMVLTANKAHFPLGMDVHAFVQAVLRECYMLQTEQLKDFAEKVKYFNELKKSIRAKLAEARNIRAQKDLAPGTQIPFDFKTWDAESGEWVVYSPSEDVLAAMRERAAEQQVELEGDEASLDDVSGADDTSPQDQAGDPVSGEWTNALAGMFRHEFATGVNPLSGKIREIWSEYGKGMKWKEMKASIFGSPTNNEFIAEITPHIAELSSSELRTLVQYVLGAYKNQTPDRDAILLAIAGKATGSQLHDLKTTNDENWYALVGADSAGRAQATLQQFYAVRDALPSSLRDDPACAGFCNLYADLFCGPIQPNPAALDKLKQEAWNLPADRAPDFIEAILEKGKRSIAEAVFFACDGEKLFSQGDPAKWAFLKDAGGRLSEFYADWTSTPVEKEINRELVSGLLKDLNAGRNDGPKMKRAFEGTPVAMGTGPGLRMSGMSGISSSLTSDEESVSTASAEPPSEPQSTLTEYHPEIMDAYIKDLEEDLQTVGDDAQLANVDLQNALQAQQQTLQMMSNISKMIHDTIMSIIRKIGG